MIDDIVISDPTSASSKVGNEVKGEEAKIIPISEVRSLIGQPLKTVVPGGEIPHAGIAEIQLYLSRKGFSYPGRVEDGISDFEWVWLTKQGTLPKRLGKWLKKKTWERKSPPDDLLAEVGSIAKRHTLAESEEFFFEITDQVDWGSAQMGQSSNGSCWWNSGSGNHVISRPQDGCKVLQYLKDSNLIVKFFPSDDQRESCLGIGRVLLAVEPDQQEWALTFNGYWRGQGATLKLTRVLSSFLGVGYKSTKVMGNNSSAAHGGRFFINNGMGYVLAGQETLLKFLSKEKEGVVDVPRVIPMVSCSGCSGRVAVAESLQILDPIFGSSLPYCTSCAMRLFDSCMNCRGFQAKGTLVEVRKFLRRSYHYRGRLRIPTSTILSWCSGCVASHAKGCAECGGIFSGVSIVAGETYRCPPCLQRLMKPCKECRVARTINRDAEGDPFCSACEEELEREITLGEIWIDPETDQIYPPATPVEPQYELDLGVVTTGRVGELRNELHQVNPNEWIEEPF